MADQKIPYQEIRGFKLPIHIPQRRFFDAISYIPNPRDVFVCCYPSTGSTWVQNIVACLMTDEKQLLDGNSPKGGADVLLDETVSSTEQSPRVLKYQMPFRYVPFFAEIKYIYLARNPKDTCVSIYQFFKTTKEFGFHGSWDEFFELFFLGDLPYGSYFDNLVSGYEHLGETNFLFHTYEELKANPKETIVKIARFLDKDVDERLVDVIDRYCYRQFSKTDDLSHLERCLTVEPGFFHVDKHVQTCSRSVSPSDLATLIPKQPAVVRKNEIGQWRFYFSPDQSERMDMLFQNEAKFTNAENLWPDIMSN